MSWSVQHIARIDCFCRKLYIQYACVVSVCDLLGVIVTVNDGSRVIQINENRGPVNISLSLDQPSCHPITIVATPQVRSPPSATGNVSD